MSDLDWFLIIASVIGVVAFVMAVPSFLQQMCGRPKISISFGHDDGESEGRMLRIHLTNPPFDYRLFRFRLLKWLGVSRSPAWDVYMSIEVFNTSTKEVILTSFGPGIGLTQSDKGIRVMLPASMLVTNVDVVRWQRDTNSAVLLGNHDIPLQESVYGINIGIGFEGGFKVSRFPALFHVGKTEDEMGWDRALVNKLFKASDWDDVHKG
jgi:hypothetical protein